MNLSTNNPKITHTKDKDVDVFDFGNILKNSDATVTVEINGNKLTNINVASTCNCTGAGIRYLDQNKAEFQVKYKNTHLAKPFAVVLNYGLKENGTEVKGKLKIKGNII